MSQLFANNAYSALGSSILIGATSLTLASGTGSRFPTPSGGDYFLLTLADTSGGSESAWEIVKVTARSVDTLTIERAQEGTTARAWASGVPVDLRLTAGAVVSSANLKTINGVTVLGSGDIVVGGEVTLTGAQELTNKTISGADNTITVDGTNAIGFRHIPQLDKTSAYTLVFSDAGKHVHKGASTAFTVTIPANAVVAFPIGTAITFVNSAVSGNMTIAITSDTMRLAAIGTTGSRTLGPYSVATAIKVTATLWIISGAGLS